LAPSSTDAGKALIDEVSGDALLSEIIEIRKNSAGLGPSAWKKM
jgi:hypothetical protein